MKFSASEFDAVRALLLGPHGHDLIEYIYRKERGQDIQDFPKECQAAPRELGWIDENGQFTPRGRCLADSIKSS